uniref:Synergin gamma C-terminal domain-containing protein n=1 Tax=Oryza punctata TaxID=4537 RepID=A0A0E0MJL3_ORYPU
MDAVAFPPPPATFLDDDLDFGDFTFSSPAPPAAAAAFDDDWGDFVATSPLGSSPDDAPAPAPPTATAKSPAWEKPRGPLPLSLFGADEDDEGPAEPPPTATATEPHAASNGSKPADLKDLIAGLYGSQPLSSPVVDEAGEAEMVPVVEDGDEFGDDGWEFKAAPSSDGGRVIGDGIEDIPKSMGSDQEDWSLFTGVDENLNHVQTTKHIETRESTGQSVNAFSCSSPNNTAILDLYKATEMIDTVHMTQSSSENENHSIESASHRALIDFYHKLREETLTIIFRFNKDFKEVQKSSMLSNENRVVSVIEREIQEICEKLQDSSLPEGLCVEERATKDVCISELLDSAKEVHLKDFEEEYHLTEKIPMALQDMSLAVELYKHSVSTLHTMEQASKEEQCDYVCAWYSMLWFCAQELKHGVVLWQESCQSNVCNIVISQGVQFFIALGEIYRVAQVLNLSMQSFKPWVLADPGMLSKMLVCWNGCKNAWTNGLETALRMVVERNNLDALIAEVLLESIVDINEIEVASLRCSLPKSKTTCRLTLLPTNLAPGMEVVIWDGDHYFVKVANLWANRISSDPPQFSHSCHLNK